MKFCRLTVLRASISLVLFPAAMLSSQQGGEAQAHADRGIEYGRSGDLVHAEAELRAAIQLDPHNPEFLAALGTFLAIDKKLEASTSILQEAVRFAPQDVTSRRYLSANLWQLHRYPEAKRQLRILLRQHPDDAPSRLLLGMVSENSRDYETAATMLSSVPGEVVKQPQSIAALARSYYHLHQSENARATLALLSSRPGERQGMLLGAQIADQAGDFETARNLLQSIKDASPDPAVDYPLALVDYHAARYAESQNELQQLIDSGVGTPQVLALLAWCYEKQNNIKASTQTFEEAIRLAPDQESMYLDLGNILLAHHSLPAALDLAKQTVTQFPESATAFDSKGQVEFGMAQFTGAIASFQKARQLDPSDADAALGLARAQSAAGLNADATTGFEADIQRFPKDARFRVGYASMLIKQAETGDAAAEPRAQRLLKSALTLDSSNGVALYQLGTLELNHGLLAEACQHLERAVKVTPQSSEAHFALARAYRRLKRPADAAREMSAYTKLNSADWQNQGMGPPADESKK